MFLIDENLSPKLVNQLSDIFPNSIHVNDVGLGSTSDTDIWNYSKENNLIILTKDIDFLDKNMMFGSPPKILLIQKGNCSTQAIEHLLRNVVNEILVFKNDTTKSILKLK